MIFVYASLKTGNPVFSKVFLKIFLARKNTKKKKSRQITLLRILRARLAYFKVLRVSMKSRSEGDTQAIIKVRELPPKESWSNL